MARQEEGGDKKGPVVTTPVWLLTAPGSDHVLEAAGGVADRRSDDVLEAVGCVAGQPRSLAAATQILPVGAGHVDAPGLHVAAPGRQQAALDQNTGTRELFKGDWSVYISFSPTISQHLTRQSQYS